MSDGWTEKTVLDVLERQRFAKSGNGGSGEYAFLRQVRNAAGFDASRTFDAMAISLWPSRGFETHVFEVKTARSDWLRELKDGAKAEAACVFADKFSIVAPGGIVQAGELPGTWGLLEVTEKRVRTVVGAPSLRRGEKRETFPAGLVISMLRSAGAVPGGSTPEEAALQAEFYRGREEGIASQKGSTEHYHDLWRTLGQEVRAFERESGIKVTLGQHGVTQEDLLKMAQKVRAAMADETHVERVRGQVRSLALQLDRAASSLREAVGDDG